MSLFIVIEGIDGSGKSTLCHSIATALAHTNQNRNQPAVTLLREPTDLPTGQKIRTFLKENKSLSADTWLHLFIEDRKSNRKENIEPALKAGNIIVQDRYFYSTAAYQHSPEKTAEQIVSLHRQAGFPEPDLLFYLDIKPRTAMQRIDSRFDTAADPASSRFQTFEKLDSLTEIYKNYDRILPASTIRLDGELPANQLTEIAVSRIHTCYENIHKKG